MTVVCVLKVSDVFTPEWVWALQEGVRRHLPGAGFKVLTDQPQHFGHWGEAMDPVLPRWWGKVLLFEPGRFSGRMLYLDLDSLPVGDLSSLAEYKGPLAMLEDFYEVRRTPRRLASGVMLWDADDPPDIYDRFMADPAAIMEQHAVRSDYWYRTLLRPDFIQDFAPGVVSLKVDARKAAPDDAILVCGHGDPRLDDPKAGWAHELWRERAYGKRGKAA